MYRKLGHVFQREGLTGRWMHLSAALRGCLECSAWGDGSCASKGVVMVRAVRRVQVRRSRVHGRGVFALRSVAAGETVLEYKGEVISWDEAQRRHPHDPTNPHHTFYFHLDSGDVIDGKVGGNSARWINHSCSPNCVTEEVDGRIFIKAERDIAAGDELFYDYRLSVEGRYTKQLKQAFACWCGSPACRGTLLFPKR